MVFYRVAFILCALSFTTDGLKVREPEPSKRAHENVTDGGYHSATTLTGHIDASFEKRFFNVSRKEPKQEKLGTGVPEKYLVDATRVAISSDTGAGQYCGCNSTMCNVDVGKVEHELANDLILIFGCSLDINAIEYFCNAVGSPLKNFQTRNSFSYLAHCDVGKFTLAYVFHAGASDPPYFSEYGGDATTATVVKNSVHDVMLQFGREPSMVLVDASLWDVSNWWEKNGRPKSPYPVPHANIEKWCTKDVPKLLAWVQHVYPRSGVAFRTPPTVFPDNGYGQDAANIDAMVKCIAEQKDPLNKLYGKYGYIDFHDFVDEALQHTPTPMQTYYKDSLHPGPTLSLMYMNKVLNWARGLQTVR